MIIGFIGAGRVAHTFGSYFMQKGIDVAGYYSHHPEAAQLVADKTGTSLFRHMEDLVIEADTIIIATPDDRIASIAAELSTFDLNWEDKLVFHMSGVHSSALLQPVYQLGASVASVHPMVSISSPDKKLDISPVYLTLEGKGKRFNELIQMVDSLGNPWIEISTEDKVIYHAAASMTSNYLVTLVGVGRDMLKEIGLDEEKALHLMQPLLKQTMNNIFQTGPERALTGPISRGDIGTITKHLHALAGINKGWLDIYTALGKPTASLARNANKLGTDEGEKIIGELKRHE